VQLVGNQTWRGNRGKGRSPPGLSLRPGIEGLLTSFIHLKGEEYIYYGYIDW
jgi:hypothetical protein